MILGGLLFSVWITNKLLYLYLNWHTYSDDGVFILPNVKVNCGAQTKSEAAGLCDVSLTGQLALRETPTGKSSIPKFWALRNQIPFGLLA